MQGTDRTEPDRCQLTPKKACNENQQDHHGRRPGRRRGDANRSVVPGWPVRAGLPAAAAHQRNTVMTATPMSDEALATTMADLRGRLRARGLSVRATEK